MPEATLDTIDRFRSAAGFRTVAELLDPALDARVFDPFSVLISRAVVLGRGNVFYPNVMVVCRDAECVLGDENLFHPGTGISAEDGGTIRIGDRGSFGPGGLQLKANRPGATLSIGDEVRLLNGAEVVRSSTLGSGAQILGAISAVGVELAAGDSYRGPDPDRRAALLKGFGRARGLRLGRGEVVNGSGDFAESAVERQAAYHAGRS
jgi:hypothetical protein